MQELGLVGCEFVAAVHTGGMAALWGQHTGRWLGWLNTAPEERVQSVWACGDGGGGLVVVRGEEGALHARSISLQCAAETHLP